MVNSLGEMCLTEGNVRKKKFGSKKKQPMTISGLKIHIKILLAKIRKMRGEG
jgi:hypothetical protein